VKRGTSVGHWLLCAMAVLGASAIAQPALIPVPVSVKTCPGEFTFDHLKPDITQPFSAVESRLAALISFGESAKKISVQIGAFNNEEAYTLSVEKDGVFIVAPSPRGALHAIATLAQLKSGNKYPCVQIFDHPRFPWRGLLLDVSRHFMPVDAVKRTLDRMAAVKLNVLHLHLADDQGVRIESKRYPLLQEKASGGQFYTQQQIQELVAFAKELGVRIVPEFDFPGHATAWFAAYPEFASAPGQYAIERKIGIFDPAFDPSNPKTYEFIEGFLEDVCKLFPDPYIHLGGDEVSGKQWDSNPKIQAFKKAKGLTSNHELQAYFETRMHQIATKLGKKLVLWDEAIQAKAPADITYQAWRGPNALLASAFLKHPTLVSYGFYLDWGLSSDQLYRNQLNGVLPDETDPILKRLNPLIPIPAARPAGMLTEVEAANRLGGEAALWSEFTTPANLDVRLWPRAAVVAERLWSPAEKSQDFDDLWRRLYTVFPSPEKSWVEGLFQPGKYVYRHLSHKYTVDSPMDQLVDRLPMESYLAQEFNRAVVVALRNRAATAGSGPLERDRAAAMLTRWNTELKKPSDLDPHLIADATLAVKIGLEALSYSDGKFPAPPGWPAASLASLKSLSDNHREIVVAICPGVIELVKAYDAAAKSAPQ
jgi:hexosaminidase